jgi:hypothetical protein
MAEEGLSARGRPTWARKRMKPEQIQLIAMAVGPVATLIVVFLGVLFQNRHVDTRIADVNLRITDLKELLRAEMRANQSELLAKFADLDNRLSRLEGERRIVR